MQWVYIAIGGALGSLLRYFLQGHIQKSLPGAFPMGTLGVNLLGSLVIGFLGAWFMASQPSTGHLRLFLMVGVLGGFTTFSSFSLENLNLLRDGHGRLAVAYILTSNVLGIGLAFAGFFLAKALIRSGGEP